MNRTKKTEPRAATRNSKSLTKNTNTVTEWELHVKLPYWAILGIMLGAAAWGALVIASMPKHQVQATPAHVEAPADYTPVIGELSYGFCEGCGEEGP